MDRDRHLLRHFLAAIAYRTQKALRGAPDHYPTFSAGNRARTPAELIRHMTSLMGYVRTHFQGGTYPAKPDPLPRSRTKSIASTTCCKRLAICLRVTRRARSPRS